MKFFVKRVFLFLLPIILLAVPFEILLRDIPNDYKNKRDYLDKHSDELAVLILGSSHSMAGLNPDHFSKSAFNASYVSQSLDMDFYIYKKYESQLNNLQYIILPISYFSFFERLETISEYWRIKNYVLYYGLDISSKIRDHSEVIGNKLGFNARRFFNYYILHQDPFSCKPNGWRERHWESDLEIEKSGKERAQIHTVKDTACFSENVEFLKSLIESARAKNVHVILYTSPAYKTYVENLEPEQLSRTIDAATDIAESYSNVSYYNLLSDPTFVEADYYDADHLNTVGAKRLSLFMNEKIKNFPKEDSINKALNLH